MDNTFEQDKDLLESTEDVDVLKELTSKYIFSSLDEESQLGVQAAKKWIEIDDNDSPHLYLGDYYRFRSEFKKYFIEYKIANDFKENYLALSFLSILYLLGYGETNTIDMENAVKCAQRSIDIYKKEKKEEFPKEAYFTMGYAYADEHFYEINIDKCEYYFLEVLKNVNDNDYLLADTHNNLGKYYLQKNKYHKAKEQFQQSLKLYEKVGIDTVIQRMNIAICDKQSGNIETANASLLSIFDEYKNNYNYLFETPYEELDPRGRDFLRIFGTVCYECGYIFEEQHDDDKAEYYYSEGLKSQHALCYTILSAFYEKRGFIEKSENVLFEAITSVKDNDPYLFNDIGCYFYDQIKETGEDPVMRDNAISYFKRSSELGLAAAELNLGKIYEFHSNNQEALAVEYYGLAEEHGDDEGGQYKKELLDYININRPKFEELVNKLREHNYNQEDLKENIRIEMVWFFGSKYPDVPDYVKDELVVGLYTYIQLLETKKDIETIDFSPSVNPISKAVEKMVHDKIALPYINFLTENSYKINISTVGKTFICTDKKGKDYFDFQDKHFSLGQLWKAVVKKDKGKYGEDIYNVYPSFIAFLQSILPKISKNKARAFTYELCRQISKFKTFRNDASHKDPLYIEKAKQAFTSILLEGNIIKYLITIENEYK